MCAPPQVPKLLSLSSLLNRLGLTRLWLGGHVQQHNRNNEDRFEDPRLEWTRHVPNTLYVFSIIDPKTKKKLIKFGRTQVSSLHFSSASAQRTQIVCPFNA
jgi:hypothetical protein